MSYYVAFSIEGTNAFITANGNVIPRHCGTFTPVSSRRPKANVATDGTKLHWSKLTTKSGKPVRSVPLVLQLFKILEKNGWKVNKDKFIKRHYKDGKLAKNYFRRKTGSL